MSTLLKMFSVSLEIFREYFSQLNGIGGALVMGNKLLQNLVVSQETDS